MALKVTRVRPGLTMYTTLSWQPCAGGLSPPLFANGGPAFKTSPAQGMPRPPLFRGGGLLEHPSGKGSRKVQRAVNEGAQRRAEGDRTTPSSVKTAARYVRTEAYHPRSSFPETPRCAPSGQVPAIWRNTLPKHAPITSIRKGVASFRESSALPEERSFLPEVRSILPEVRSSVPEV